MKHEWHTDLDIKIQIEPNWQKKCNRNSKWKRRQSKRNINSAFPKMPWFIFLQRKTTMYTKSSNSQTSYDPLHRKIGREYNQDNKNSYVSEWFSFHPFEELIRKMLRTLWILNRGSRSKYFSRHVLSQGIIYHIPPPTAEKLLVICSIYRILNFWLKLIFHNKKTSNLAPSENWHVRTPLYCCYKRMW